MAFTPEQYALLDFGSGRKLERFGPHVLDRPAPACENVSSASPELWPQADARFSRTAADRGEWHFRRDLPERWVIQHERLHFDLKLTDFGHVGVFPEQAENWAWIAQRIAQLKRPLNVLNLFAYTGGSTLAAAAAGGRVVHVDAAKNMLAWARRNAELSNLAAAPIRWIAEDAMKFVQRELRRGRRYDAVILDPPSYGHGPGGQRWKISEHLDPLLVGCAELCNRRPSLVLITCHTPGVSAKDLARKLRQSQLVPTRSIETLDLALIAPDGRRLPSGCCARWNAESRSPVE